MGKRALVTIDWLRKGRMVEDLTILRNLIADSSAWKVGTAILDETRFEETFGLQPLPNEATTGVAINRALAHEEVTEKVTTKMKPLIPIGNTVRAQVRSLFPTNLSENEKDTLSYVFSRFVLDDTPKDIEWPLVPEGLDSLSAALFTINMVANLIGEENPWLLPLWEMKVEELRLESLLKIHDAVLSNDELEDIIDVLEDVREVLRSLIPQDSLYDIITKWLASLRADLQKSKREIAETLNATASEVLKEIDLRKSADLQRMTLTQWNIHALRPDGPSASVHEPMLKKFRQNINILDFEPLTKVCELLSKSEKAGQPSAAVIEKVAGTKRRMSHYTLQRMSFVLTEKFIPSISKLGLRYRFIFAEKRRQHLQSEGLVERMELSESSYEDCSVHLEPEKSHGPSKPVLSSSVQLTADSDLISMRLDLYDRKSGKWTIGPWDDPSKSHRRTSKWLFRETQYDKQPPVNLTSRQVDILGSVLAFQGLRGARTWMLDKLDLPQRTARRYLRVMLNDKILRLLYTPALEYCGLPEGMIAVGKFKQKQSRNSFIAWLTARTPYARIFTDKSTNMIAFIRLPPYKTDIVGGAIEEKLSEGGRKNRITTHSFTTRLRSYKTYQMTVFQRLFQEDGIIDPWEI